MMKYTDEQLVESVELAISDERTDVIGASLRLAIFMYNDFVKDQGLLEEFVKTADSDEKAFALLLTARLAKSEVPDVS